MHIKNSNQRWRSYNEIQREPPRYDAYICGSDQIWNPYMCRPDKVPKNDPAYFLSFAPANRRVAYAPSISVPTIPDHLKEEFAELVAGVRFLSCRELSGAALVEAFCGRPVKWVADPVLLLDGPAWQALANHGKPANPEEPARYVFCYFLGDGRDYRVYAKELAREHGLGIKIISSVRADIEYLDGEDAGSAGPAEFLALVMGATCVCTDSFHGTLFSIIFERPFYVFERPGSSGRESMVSRIESVLTRLGLSDQLTSPGSQPPSTLSINFVEARAKLKIFREESIDYLRHALQTTTSDE